MAYEQNQEHHRKPRITEFTNAKEAYLFLRKNEGKETDLSFYELALLLARAEDDPLTGARIAVEGSKRFSKSKNVKENLERSAKELYEEACEKEEDPRKKALIHAESWRYAIFIKPIKHSDEALDLYMRAIETAESKSLEEALDLAWQLRFEGCALDYLRLFYLTKAKTINRQAMEELVSACKKYYYQGNVLERYLELMENKGRKNDADLIRRLLQEFDKR